MEKNTILINKKIGEKQRNIEITGDVIVPDSKPDILSIIATNINPYINKEEISDEKYRFDGITNTNIIYLSDNGDTQNIQTNLSFMELIEDEFFNENTITQYNIMIANIETKIINERKVNVTIKLKIDFEFYENTKIEYLNELDSEKNIEKLQESIDVNTIITKNQITTTLQEDFNIETGKEINSILKTDISIINIENKISYNKVLSKGDVSLKILYLNQELKVETFETSMPIMNFIDMENITENETCEINYKIRNLEFSLNKQEKNKINFKAEFDVFCIAYKLEKINVIQDLYGTEKMINFESKKVEIQTSNNIENEIANINENILIEDIREIYDVDCRANIVNRTSVGSMSNYEAEVFVEIYYGTGNTLSVKNVKIPFVFKMNTDSENLKLSFSRKHFKLSGEDVVLDLGIEIISSSNNCKEINVISNIKEEELENEDDYSMIIYFVKSGDTIWKIAKNFRVSMNELTRLNNLEDNNKIYPGEKLYILK